MSAPFFDPALVVAALDPLIPEYVASVQALGSVAAADPAKRVRQLPGLVVVAERTSVQGPQGLGNARRIFERMAIVAQVREPSGRDADADAEASLYAIRCAVYDLLEATSLAATWAPLRYDGGQVLAIGDGVYSRIDYWLTETASHTFPRT